MNRKWHINKKGVPTVCKAVKGKCPLGTHYESEKEAMNAVNIEMENQYDLLPTSKMSTQKKKDLATLIQRISGTTSKGFDYECYASLSLAEELGLNKVAITDENGLTVNISTDDMENNSLNVAIVVDRSIEGVSKYYESIGIPIKDKGKLARVVYHSDDPNKEILVQSGGPNVLDAAIIKADEVVDIIEVKELGNGAQLPVTTLNVDGEGNVTPESLTKESEYIQKALEGIKIQDADGTDIKLNFGNEDNNKKFPLYHFVEEYKKKGATSFIYTTDEGETINKIDLTKNIDTIVNEMINKNIEATVNLRANLSKRNATKDDIERFNKILSKEYFKSGRASETESFTLKSIKENQIRKSGEFVRIGGYVLPIEYDNYKDSLNKRINKKDMKAFNLSLTGRIKTNY